MRILHENPELHGAKRRFLPFLCIAKRVAGNEVNSNVTERHLFLCEKFIDKITIIDIMVTIRAIYYINVVKMYTLKAGGTCRKEYYPC